MFVFRLHEGWTVSQFIVGAIDQVSHLEDDLVKIVILAPRNEAVATEEVLRQFADDICDSPASVLRFLQRFSQGMSDGAPAAESN